jgi:glutamine amidotransferase
MIAIIDYQMGNLRSVQKAFERVGHAAAITSDGRILAQADHVVLPGVGAFADAMAELRRRHLLEPIREAIDSGRPFLGICLGMQLLFEVSHEDGQHEGLGVVRGEVRRFAPSGQYKVPHMGWNEVSFRRRGPIFSGVDEGAHFYFVHSYYVAPFDANVIDGEASYPERFCATIWRDNLFATQFHPEKSQAVGLQVLKNFAAL